MTNYPKGTTHVTANTVDWLPISQAYRITVRYCKDADGKFYRMKRFDPDMDGKGCRYTAVTEAHIHAMSKHMNLVTAWSVISEPIKPEHVLSAVCMMCDVTAEDIRSKKRSPELTKARSLVCVVLHDDLNLSYPQISAIVRPGSKHHTTCMEAAKRARSRSYGPLGPLRASVLAAAKRELLNLEAA